MSSEIIEHEREVFNFMDLIGNLGGVMELLTLLIGWFILPVSEHSFILKAFQKLYLAKTNRNDVF